MSNEHEAMWLSYAFRASLVMKATLDKYMELPLPYWKPGKHGQNMGYQSEYRCAFYQAANSTLHYRDFNEQVETIYKALNMSEQEMKELHEKNIFPVVNSYWKDHLDKAKQCSDDINMMKKRAQIYIEWDPNYSNSSWSEYASRPDVMERLLAKDDDPIHLPLKLPLTKNEEGHYERITLT